jgi:hypothetical protein
MGSDAPGHIPGKHRKRLGHREEYSLIDPCDQIQQFQRQRIHLCSATHSFLYLYIHMRLGYHVYKSHDLDGKKVARSLGDAVAADHGLSRAYGFEPHVQIFVAGPRDHKLNVTPADYPKILAADCGIVIHGSYVDYLWGRTTGRECLALELEVAEAIGATGVIVHLGGESPARDLEWLAGCKTRLWLETNATKPSAGSYETADKLRRCLEITGLPVGICVDTAHLHSCGVSLRTRTQASGWFDALESLGLPWMLHLNDSAAVAGSGRDAHAGLCVGNIWSDYNPATGKIPFGRSGLCEILRRANDSRADVILERAALDIPADLNLVKSTEDLWK